MPTRTSAATVQPVFPGWRATKGMKEALGNLENTILQPGRWEVAGMPVSPAAHLLGVPPPPQVWLLCLPGGCRTTGSSRSPRKRGAKGKKVLCEILTKWNMENPILKIPYSYETYLANMGQRARADDAISLSHRPVQRTHPNCSDGRCFAHCYKLKWSSVNWSCCLFREAKESGATLECMGRKAMR